LHPEVDQLYIWFYKGFDLRRGLQTNSLLQCSTFTLAPQP
jgi:hypothetical protein